MLQQPRHAARVHDLPAVLARSGSDVDDPVGRPDGVLVMLDDDQGVAEILQPDQGFDQPLVVSLVQPDGRLVQDVEDANETCADLRCEPNPLSLSARERSGGSVEREVVEPDVEQEVEPFLDLLDDSFGDLTLTRAQIQRGQEVGRSVDRERTHLGDVQLAMRTGGERHRTGNRLQPRTTAAPGREPRA